VASKLHPLASQASDPDGAPEPDPVVAEPEGEDDEESEVQALNTPRTAVAAIPCKTDLRLVFIAMSPTVGTSSRRGK
jgi:hypothetical protein